MRVLLHWHAARESFCSLSSPPCANADLGIALDVVHGLVAKERQNVSLGQRRGEHIEFVESLQVFRNPLQAVDDEVQIVTAFQAHDEVVPRVPREPSVAVKPRRRWAPRSRRGTQSRSQSRDWEALLKEPRAADAGHHCGDKEREDREDHDPAGHPGVCGGVARPLPPREHDPKLRFPREAGGVTRAGISNLRFDSRVEICAQDLWHRSCATDPARGERGARAKRTWPERIGCLPRKSARPGGAACLRGSRGPRSLAGRGA